MEIWGSAVAWVAMMRKSGIFKDIVQGYEGGLVYPPQAAQSHPTSHIPVIQPPMMQGHIGQMPMGMLMHPSQYYGMTPQNGYMWFQTPGQMPAAPPAAPPTTTPTAQPMPDTTNVIEMASPIPAVISVTSSEKYNISSPDSVNSGESYDSQGMVVEGDHVYQPHNASTSPTRG